MKAASRRFDGLSRSIAWIVLIWALVACSAMAEDPGDFVRRVYKAHRSVGIPEEKVARFFSEELQTLFRRAHELDALVPRDQKPVYAEYRVLDPMDAPDGLRVIPSRATDFSRPVPGIVEFSFEYKGKITCDFTIIYLRQDGASWRIEDVTSMYPGEGMLLEDLRKSLGKPGDRP